MVTALFLVIWVISLIFVAYSIVNESYWTSPHKILLLGIVICLIAAVGMSIVNMLGGIEGFEEYKANIKTGGDFIMITLAAFGGGIISAAFNQKMALENKSGIGSLKSLLKNEEAFFNDFQKIYEEFADDGDLSPEDSARKTHLLVMLSERNQKIKDMKKELEELSKLE